MNYLAIDLGTRTGWATFTEGESSPHYGSWVLPGDPGEVGRKCVMLHRNMADLHVVTPFDRIYFEAGIPAGGLSGFTNLTTLNLLVGLASHVESFAYAVNARVRSVPNTTWKKHFIGRGVRRGTSLSAEQFKRLSITRCRELGWSPPDNDCADALGVLDYTIHLAGITPPWLEAAAFGRAQL